MVIQKLFLIILIVLISCNSKGVKNYFINSDIILSNVKYKAIINDIIKDKKMFSTY